MKIDHNLQWVLYQDNAYINNMIEHICCWLETIFGAIAIIYIIYLISRYLQDKRRKTAEMNEGAEVARLNEKSFDKMKVALTDIVKELKENEHLPDKCLRYALKPKE